LTKNHLAGVVSLNHGSGNPIFRNGTRVIKFFFHLSEEEQHKGFPDRIDKTEKTWKFSQADIKE